MVLKKPSSEVTPTRGVQKQTAKPLLQLFLFGLESINQTNLRVLCAIMRRGSSCQRKLELSGLLEIISVLKWRLEQRWQRQPKALQTRVQQTVAVLGPCAMVASLRPSQDDGISPGVHRYNCCAGSVVQYFTDPSRLDGYSLFFLKGREGEEDNETTKPNETQQNFFLMLQGYIAPFCFPCRQILRTLPVVGCSSPEVV